MRVHLPAEVDKRIRQFLRIDPAFLKIKYCVDIRLYSCYSTMVRHESGLFFMPKKTLVIAKIHMEVEQRAS